MNKFEQYADAVRSGKYSQMGDIDITTPYKYEPRREPRWPLIVSIMISTLLFGALLYLLYEKQINEGLDKVERVGKAQFVAWANDIGLGLDCVSMTVKNKQQVILHNCSFNTAEERELRKIRTL